MAQEKIHFVDGCAVTDSDKLPDDLVPVAETNLRFNAVEIADALGVQPGELVDRMCNVLARALCIDALNLACDEMRAQGLHMGLDGWPPGWPLLHVVAITQARLFPEKSQ